MLRREGIFVWNQLQLPMTGEEECLFHLENGKKGFFFSQLGIHSIQEI